MKYVGKVTEHSHIICTWTPVHWCTRQPSLRYWFCLKYFYFLVYAVIAITQLYVRHLYTDFGNRGKSEEENIILKEFRLSCHHGSKYFPKVIKSTWKDGRYGFGRWSASFRYFVCRWWKFNWIIFWVECKWKQQKAD